LYWKITKLGITAWIWSTLITNWENEKSSILSRWLNHCLVSL
jgi:hypothetical protein